MRRFRFCNPAARFLSARRGVMCFAVATAALVAAAPAFSQAVNLFPKDYQDQWVRTTISAKEPLTNIAQWHIDPAKRVIVCDGNGGDDWVRFHKELHKLDFHAQSRFT